MRLIKKALIIILFPIALLAFATGGVYLAFYDSWSDFSADIKVGKRAVWMKLFVEGYVHELSADDVRYVYEKRCYRQCHGEAAMITAVLSQSGWFQVVERMRVKEGAKMSGPEANVILQYLEETYPTTKSPYTFEARKATHKEVWRNDMGQGDIYADVIYTTREYLSTIGAENLIKEYEVNDYYVFIVSFTVHEGEVAVADLDELSFLSVSGEPLVANAPPWSMRFQTADKHHYEAVIRFAKEKFPQGGEGRKTEIKLVIKNIGGPDDRVFTWDTPIVYPAEVIEQMKMIEEISG